MTQLTKTAAFTDIHWGAKSNSEMHNRDCMNYIDWFCEQVKADPTIDNIIFMGDWFENRSALNVSTMDWSYRGAKKLNELNLPIYFIVGNHDLYHRHTRAVYSTVNFQEFSNFNMIVEPTVIQNIGDGVLLCPFLFHNEYPSLIKYNKLDTWWGHFEFKGFLVTGYGMKMPTGPEASDFSGPKRIMSGHFHQRQQEGNVVYIGNAFPSNFGDAGDSARGMVVYDHKSDDMKFIDWGDCPKYIRTTLTDLLDGTTTVYPESRIKCIVDVPISYEESIFIKEKYTADFKLREFALEESTELKQVLENTDVDELESLLGDNDLAGATLDELVIAMLKSIDTDKIDTNILISQYSRLKLC